jgi:hypothetical protein
MKQELMPDRISYTETEPLTPGEVTLLKDKIVKRLIIYIPGYLVLAAIGINILWQGPDILNDRPSFPLQPLEIDERVKSNFWIAAPYFCLFLFVASTIFIIIYYFQALHPLIKDIKRKEKLFIFYKPKKSAMPFFNRFYISTPLYKNQQIEVSKTDFDNITEEDLLCLEVAPCSTFLLKLRNKEKRIHTDDLTL